MKRYFILLFSLWLLLPVLYAQMDEAQPLPADTRLRIGRLENGLTYYLMHNEEPRQRASFYIIQNVGSLMEEDEQNGLAHFLEHMAFNGTQNLPGKTMLDYLQSKGISFGSNINAFTSYDETVYNISQVPVGNENLTDTCLLVLHDWSHFLSLEEEEIDNERGVITEEWRTRNNADFRLNAQINAVLWAGSRYAERDIIGRMEIVQHFPYEALRAYYHRWYRPDLQAIAVVGDVDIDRIEQKIKQLFADIPVADEPAARPDFPIPYHQAPRFVLATDREAFGVTLELRRLIPAVRAKQTVGDLRREYVVELYNEMLRNRLQELSMSARPPFISASSGFSSYLRGYDLYSTFLSVKNGGEEEGLAAIVTELARIRQHGFTATELDLAKKSLQSYIDQEYSQRNKKSNDYYAQHIQNHFLRGETFCGAEAEYDLFQRLLPAITPEEVHRQAVDWLQTDNTTLILSSPEGLEHPSEKCLTGLFLSIDTLQTSPLCTNDSLPPFFPYQPQAGQIVAERKLPYKDACEWTLSNGARVVFLHNDDQKESVSLLATAPGGTSLLADSLLSTAYFFNDFLGCFGLGTHSMLQFNKLLTGHQASAKLNLRQLSQEIEGFARRDELECMFQQVWMLFCAPRFDREAYDSYLGRYLSYMENSGNDSFQQIQDTLFRVMSSNHPRTRNLNRQTLQQVKYEQLEKIYRQCYADTSGFVFLLVGDVQAEAVRPLAERYLASLPSLRLNESWKDNDGHTPAGVCLKEIPLSMPGGKAAVYAYYNNEQLAHNYFNDRCMDVLSRILQIRYTDIIREREGGSYGVSVAGGYQRAPYPLYSLQMNFDCDRTRSRHLYSLLHCEVEAVAAEAPTTQEVQQCVAAMLKEREQVRSRSLFDLRSLYELYTVGEENFLPSHYEEIVQRLTGDDIRSFCRKFLEGCSRTDFIFGRVEESGRH